MVPTPVTEDTAKMGRSKNNYFLQKHASKPKNAKQGQGQHAGGRGGGRSIKPKPDEASLAKAKLAEAKVLAKAEAEHVAEQKKKFELTKEEKKKATEAARAEKKKQDELRQAENARNTEQKKKMALEKPLQTLRRQKKSLPRRRSLPPNIR